MLGLPVEDVMDPEMIPFVLSHCVADVDDHEGTDGVGGGQIADGGAERVPVGGRVELGAVLVGGEIVGGGDEPVLLVGELLPQLYVALDGLAGDRGLEPGVAEAGPDGLDWLEGMGQVNVLGVFEDALVGLP